MHPLLGVIRRWLSSDSIIDVLDCFSLLANVDANCVKRERRHFSVITETVYIDEWRSCVVNDESHGFYSRSSFSTHCEPISHLGNDVG